MKKVFILVHEGFFTQQISEYQNIDIKFVAKKLKDDNWCVELLEYAELAKQSFKIDDSAIYWAGSHQNLDVKQFINDILIARFNQRDNLIPRLETILSHENKGMQGVLAAELDLGLIYQDYHCASPGDAEYHDNNKTLVFKSLGGAGSVGVSLVKNNRQYNNKVLKSTVLNTTLTNVLELLKNVVRKVIGRKEQAKYLRKYARYVTQQFVEGLEFDYKVLVFGNHVYFLKRYVRANDFRASGSGKFVFEDRIDQKLVDFALDCRKKLDVPYCSLDLIEYDKGKVGLIEFQTVHFGPYTQIESATYFDESIDCKCVSKFSFEDELVLAFVKYNG